MGIGRFDAELDAIARDESRMVAETSRWCAINSGSYHRAGLERLSEDVVSVFAPLASSTQRVALPAWTRVDDDGHTQTVETADALVFQQRPEAPRQVLLAIHLDTVYPPESPFQAVTSLADRRIGGPGVADAKGGIALLRAVLGALEASERAEALGWTVVLNPDEEIGSPASRRLLAEEAIRADFGLVFEPCLPDGSMISHRKGSGNFALVARGRAAHVGRAFAEGRSAIHAIAACVDAIAGWNDAEAGVIANTGAIRGGGALNVVPEFALARVNLRVDDAQQQREASEKLEALAARISRDHDVEIEVSGAFLSPPKECDRRMEALMKQVERAGKDVGVELSWRKSGGVCDGNKLAAAGLPNVDTMGPQGGDIHSEREYLLLDSLVPRAQMCAALLLKYAGGEFELPEAEAWGDRA